MSARYQNERGIERCFSKELKYKFEYTIIYRFIPTIILNFTALIFIGFDFVYLRNCRKSNGLDKKKPNSADD